MSQSHDHLRKRLNSIRNKLFDFGLKNPLLNYKFPPKASVRIVDALSDMVYDKLCEERDRLIIESTDRIEEFDLQKTTSFKKLMRSPDYRPPLLSMLPGKELEKALSNIAKTAKSLMAESGVNTLYLVFGFLEWREAADAEASYFAPILMAPIELRPNKLDPKTKSVTFSIELSGEGVEINPVLREWIKHEHSPYRLPDFLEEDTPESYFDKLRESVRAIPGMKVRNQITISLLSISSLLMYKDLDADENPKILTRPFIRHLLSDTRDEGTGELINYPIDDPKIDHDLPPLIYDADSSQHSALIDAMYGRNLVIEGPPGTGKSQTITNLIAAALDHGKTVLFVSEKKAALDVVHKRLAQCGLDPFCLELHSSKTKLSDLVNSLQLRYSIPSPTGTGTLLDKRVFLNDNKRKLTRYAEAINHVYGKCGQTIHEAIWLHQKLRKDFSFNPLLLDPVLITGAEELTFEQVEHLKQSAEIYGQHLSLITNGKCLQQHPWYGVNNWQISSVAEREIVLALQAIVNISNQIQKQIDDLNKVIGQELLIGEASLKALLQSKDALPVFPTKLMADLVPKLVDQNSYIKLATLTETLERYHQIRDNLQQGFSKTPDVNSAELAVLQAYCLEVRQMEIDWRTIEEFHAYINNINGHADYLSQISSWFRSICLYLGCQLPFTVQNVSLIVNLLRDKS